MRTQILGPHDASTPQTAFRTILDALYRQGRLWRFSQPAPSALPRWQQRLLQPKSLSHWQEETRGLLLELLGNLDFEDTPLDLRREIVLETPTYQCERLQYQTLPGITVPALLLTPQGLDSPAPAILCPPGHGNGMRQVIEEADAAYKGYPVELARHGFVCLVPENLGFGERQDPARQSGHDYYDHALNLLGYSSLGVMRHDLACALDVLAALPETDTQRIGCWGLSLGGELTLLLAATDLRVRAAAISGFFSSYYSSFLAVPHCSCGYAPGLARYLEHADIAALIAPRPLWIEMGDSDTLFPFAATEAAVQELSVAYAMAGDTTGGALTYHLFPGAHEVSGDAAINWFLRTLRAA